MRLTPSRLARLALLGLAALLLAACAKDDYYLLPPPAAPNHAPAASGSVSVSDFGLPTYADAAEIATLSRDGSVALGYHSLWADLPRRALTRHFIAALQQRLGGIVSSEPWPGFDTPSVRVDVQVDQVIGAADQPFRFGGQYILVNPSSGRVLASRRFAYTLTSRAQGYRGLLASHAEAIDRLADDIAARIAGLGRDAV